MAHPSLLAVICCLTFAKVWLKLVGILSRFSDQFRQKQSVLPCVPSYQDVQPQHVPRFSRIIVNAGSRPRMHGATNAYPGQMLSGLKDCVAGRGRRPPLPQAAVSGLLPRYCLGWHGGGCQRMPTLDGSEPHEVSDAHVAGGGTILGVSAGITYTEGFCLAKMLDTCAS